MRHLRALLALAEELNFTRAAERLHLTQQALSGQIRQLEDARRNAARATRLPPRASSPEPAQTLLEHARPLLAGAEHAILATRAAGAEPARLTVGYVAPFTRRLVAPAFDTFCAAYPQTEVTIHFAGFLDPLGGLRDGPGRRSDSLRRVRTRRHRASSAVQRKPRGIALAADHHLAARSDITIEDFIAQPLVEEPRPRPDLERLLDRRAPPHRRAAPDRRLGDNAGRRSWKRSAPASASPPTVAPAIDMLGTAAGVVFRPVAGALTPQLLGRLPGTGRQISGARLRRGSDRGFADRIVNNLNPAYPWQTTTFSSDRHKQDATLMQHARPAPRRERNRQSPGQSWLVHAARS